ncbi:hypothetical protein L7F22_027831 [Adiantum nelumboides]|nr:hypothetical protein [Adiantum nelumboides]
MESFRNTKPLDGCKICKCKSTTSRFDASFCDETPSNDFLVKRAANRGEIKKNKSLQGFFSALALISGRNEERNMYRINYYILLVSFLLLFAGVLRSPIVALGAVLTTFATACINDSFAMFVNEKVLRCARRIYPPLAAKMRAPLTPGGRARPSKGTIHICGKERSHVVAMLLSVSVLSWFLSAQIKILGLTVCLLMTVVLAHASFRMPNLKARLNTFREEFRAVWRSYSDI